MDLTLAFSFGDLAYAALSVFLLAVGLGLGYAFFRLGGTLGRLSAFIKGTQEELLPVIHKVGGTVDRVNGQLDKVDRVTDSAVDAADRWTLPLGREFADRSAVQKHLESPEGVAFGVAICARTGSGAPPSRRQSAQHAASAISTGVRGSGDVGCDRRRSR